MKKIQYIILFFFFIACNSNTKDINTTTNNSDSLKAKNINVHTMDTTNIHRDTILINNIKYIQTIIKEDQFACLTSLNGDTIIPFADFYFKIKLLDINKDGYKDIRVLIFSNAPNQCDNYLYDKNSKNYRIIEDCSINIEKIKGTDYYYSICKAGCAAMDWDSYLSKIENYKQTNYGYIYIQGCDFEIKENLQVIEIYKVTNSENDTKILIKKLPFKKYISNHSDWDFIKRYWKRNYRNFEK